ncbi:Uncharacterised protein g1952 [Pycnogonum litorale]
MSSVVVISTILSLLLLNSSVSDASLARQCQCTLSNIKTEDLLNVNASRGQLITGAILYELNSCSLHKYGKCERKCIESYRGPLDFDMKVAGQALGQLMCQKLVKNSRQYVGYFADVNGCRSIRPAYLLRHSKQKLCCKDHVYNPNTC